VSNNLDTREKITIGGAPRSGSTYLKYFLTCQYKGSELFIQKTHLELDHLDRIKNPDKEETWLIPVRNAMDTAKSILAWQNHKEPKNFLDKIYSTTTLIYGTLDSITRLWETILLDKSKFIFLDFNLLISDKNYVETKLESNISRLLVEKCPFKVSDKEIKDNLEKDDRNNFLTEEDYLNMGHIPRNKSEILKNLDIIFDSDVYTKRLQYLDSLSLELLS